MAKEGRNNAGQELRPVTPRDFAPGQKACILHESCWEDKAMEVTVVRTGQECVEVEDCNGWTSVHYSSGDCGYLIRGGEWGSLHKLFPDMQALEAYCLKKAIHKELRIQFNAGLEYFTMEQLQAIKEILDDNDEKREGE